MRVRFVLGVMAASGLVSVACTSLLGDYSIGEGPSDGSTEAATDAPSVDAPADGPTAVKLTCQESKVVPRVHLGDVQGGNGGSAPDRVWLFDVPSQNGSTVRALVPGLVPTDGGGATPIIHTYTFQSDGNGNTPVDTPLYGGQLVAAARYPTGIAALVLDGGSGALTISKMDDASGDGGPPTWSAYALNATSNIPVDACRVVASLYVVDASTDEYVIAISYSPSNCAGTPVLAANDTLKTEGFVSWPLVTTPDGGALQYDLARDAIVVDGPTAYVLVNPNSGGPAPGLSPVVYSASASTLTSPTMSPLQLAAPTHLLYPLGMKAALTPGSVDIGLLGGDLAGQTLQAGLFVGERTLASLPSLKPETDLAATMVANINDLPVDKGAAHWDIATSPTSSENLLALSRVGAGGANLWWFDAQGGVRARQTGPSALFPSDVIIGLDGVLVGTVLGGYAQMEVVMTEAADAGSYSVWGVQLTCTP